MLGEIAAERDRRGRLIRLALLPLPGVLALAAGTAGHPGWAQVALVPVLYLVQESARRLGRPVSLTALGLAALGLAGFAALVSGFGVVAWVGGLAGLPRALPVGVVALALGVVVLTGCRRIACVGIAVGALEVLFLPVAVLVRPGAVADPVLTGAGLGPLLLAALMGTVLPGWWLHRQRLAAQREPCPAWSGWLFGAMLLGAVIMGAVIIGAVLIAGPSLHGGQRRPAVPLGPVLARHSALVLFGLAVAGVALVLTLLLALAGRAVAANGPVLGGLVAAAGVAVLAPALVGWAGVLAAGLLAVVLAGLLVAEHRVRPARWALVVGLTCVVLVVGVLVAVRAR